MKYFWIIFVLHLSPTLGIDPKAHFCCDSDENLMVKSACKTKLSEKKRISLNCDEKITLNHFEHSDDKYEVLGNGSLHVDEYNLVIPYEE